MAITTRETAGAREWIARPNRSLTPAVRRGLIGLILAANTLIGLGFWLAGAWPVLPFAGLELLLLFVALRALARRDAAFESIRLEGDRLTVTRHLPEGESCDRFHAGWARVSLEGEPPDVPLVCIRSHGRRARVGVLMTPAQRHLLAMDLRQRLQP